MKPHANNQLVELVNLFHAYEQQNPGATVADFCRYHLATEKMKDEEKIMSPVTEEEVPLTGRLGRLLGIASKYADFYWRKMVELTGLDSVEDFGYLACTYQLKSPTKSELILYNISSFPSGIEVIKRLVRKGWLEESPDAHDKRSKRLAVTPEGLLVLQRCIPAAQHIADVIFPMLTHEEQEILHQLLSKLNRHHAERYPGIRQKNMAEILEITGESGNEKRLG
ncbi:MAG: winged helix DNA-binding protein [Cytophagales bacterium]|nr:winged helix DNA-binding protein [Cytophagales bacterium]